MLSHAIDAKMTHSAPTETPTRSNEAFEIPCAIGAIEAVIGDAPRPVSLHEPRFAGHEWDYVKETLDSGWVSSVGKYVDRFEEMLAEHCEVSHAIATVNGTAALHACLLLAGVATGDEVLVPALTFIATANAVSYCGAIPHFCDSEHATLGLDPDKLDRHLAAIAEVTRGQCSNRETGRRIAAAVPMHTFGHPVRMERLTQVLARWNIPIIEDAAEALGSRYRERHVGHHGMVTALSFNGNKPVTTGGGGAIVTTNAEVARAAKHLTTTAKSPHQWAFLHDQVGYNYRLPNINAALGCAQLEQLDQFVAAKRSLARRYRNAFHNVPGASIFVDADYAQSNYWLVTMLLDEPNTATRDAFLAACHERGLLCRPVWTTMHRLPMYQHCPRMDLRVAEELEARIVNLPSSMFLELDRK
jgi:perosamine synthetase